MKSKFDGLLVPFLGIVAVISFISLLAYGYVMNLVGLINLEPFIWTAKTVIGVGGVFVPPIGVIMGLFVW